MILYIIENDFSLFHRLQEACADVLRALEENESLLDSNNGLEGKTISIQTFFEFFIQICIRTVLMKMRMFF